MLFPEQPDMMTICKLASAILLFLPVIILLSWCMFILKEYCICVECEIPMPQNWSSSYRELQDSGDIILYIR